MGGGREGEGEGGRGRERGGLRPGGGGGALRPDSPAVDLRPDSPAAQSSAPWVKTTSVSRQHWQICIKSNVSSN